MTSTWTVPSYGDEWTVPGYTEERELGHGASGKVVRAVNDESGNRVAIKYLKPILLRDPAFMWGFRAEAQMLRELGVPQVVQVYDYVEQPGQGAAIVMELIEGASLHEMIERRGPTGPEAALTVLKGSLLGLAAAHALGIVHRDYKPENVLVDASGNSKLADFGVAIRWGRQAPAAGTPLYMAPEQWHGAPASAETDVYAATAVFYECLTGKPPFSGKLLELQEQHVSGTVPLEQVDEPLRGLVARGLAKNPAGRPESAIAFVSELESLAASTYGPDWEETGRSQLAERVAAILPLLLSAGRPSASGRSYVSTWEGGVRKSRIVTVTTVAAMVVLAAGAVAAAVTAKNNTDTQSQLSGATAGQSVTATDPTFAAVADVTPPVSASTCATPSTFTYKATISSTESGTMKYQWVYSSGKPGPVQTATFSGAGQKVVTGETVKTATAGTGWGEVKEISPKPRVLDKASYQNLCNGGGQVSASASIDMPSDTVTCGAPPPTLTANGWIYAAKKGLVSYYWRLSNGERSAPQTLNFTAPDSTLAAAPMTITPVSDQDSGNAVLVVTSPASVSSTPATYALSCTTAAPSKSPSPSKSASPSPSASSSPTPSASPSSSPSPSASPSRSTSPPPSSAPPSTVPPSSAPPSSAPPASTPPQTTTASPSGLLPMPPSPVGSPAA